MEFTEHRANVTTEGFERVAEEKRGKSHSLFLTRGVRFDRI